jgi:peptidoglycan/LPS O-acetylase OafA/YrhL
MGRELVDNSRQSGRLLRKHMPELDVLRGMAILSVLLYHGLYWDGGHVTGKLSNLVVKASVFGWLGVNLFFVLSGFLITGILLDTKGRPDYYRRFYLRRVQRILPAYLATIAVLYLFHYLTPGAVLVSLLFLVNYDKSLPVTTGYGPFWSLAVEEQFYLLWPMLVAKVNIRIFTAIAIAICLLDPVLRYLVGSGHIHWLGDVHVSTILIADNLAMGALAAVFVRSPQGSLRNGRKWGLAIMLAGLLALVTGLPFGILHRTTVLGATLQTTPWNLFFTGLLLLLLGLQSPWCSSAFAAPLRFLGYISYGLYLIHLLVFDAYDWFVKKLSVSLQPTFHQLFLRFLIAGSAAIMVSWLSRRFFEEPFLRRRPGNVRNSKETNAASGHANLVAQQREAVSAESSSGQV